MNRSQLLFYSTCLLLLAGCARLSTQTPTKFIMPSDAPQESIPKAVTPVQIPETITLETAPKPVMSGNPAVIALLDRAQLDSVSGKLEAAGALLERGLRIEPRNAWLWQVLAQLRLTQGQYAQAISLARKSISFAGHDRRLLALDWRVIGNARIAQGDSTGAEQALNVATAIELAAKAESDHGN